MSDWPANRHHLLSRAARKNYVQYSQMICQPQSWLTRSLPGGLYMLPSSRTIGRTFPVQRVSTAGGLH
jgi:hypothetical protein